MASYNEPNQYPRGLGFDPWPRSGTVLVQLKDAAWIWCGFGGGAMEQWCLLKEQLGFSLHSQLAKFLLDRLGAGSRALGEGT